MKGVREREKWKKRVHKQREGRWCVYGGGGKEEGSERGEEKMKGEVKS